MELKDSTATADLLEDDPRWFDLPARQQPEWPSEAPVEAVRRTLQVLPAVAEWHEIETLRSLLAEVATGSASMIQAGDCAEDPAQCTPSRVSAKAALVDDLAGALAPDGGDVVRVGRIAGQFGKPRSQDWEEVGDMLLPVFRGFAVNAGEADPEARRPDPNRLLSCYHAALDAATTLRERAAEDGSRPHRRLWTSHEALLLDYETPFLRRDPWNRPLLTSTHLPWVGERTRQLDGAHIRLLSTVVNPVACKIGPRMTPEELLALCARLDPHRSPGRLTLIARLGADRVAEVLPGLVAAVRDAGHPVIWLCDPMHGNTITAPDGRKTRLVHTMRREIRLFREVLDAARVRAAGLHLEATPEAVGECVADDSELDRVGVPAYSTACDPRLNSEQAIELAREFSAATSEEAHHVRN
ncbi:3-deoxy-7-phosphoheptulonate synthase [Saccharomonospora azurea]|uniref:Phospho-2-dehydro-3-deoxyheptonate aldolase n=1 Tax=Saccharomonospora azurea NA-128 TaxID=882081 RepID=H8G463_9PSEU|nr:3-deoxy-7-phosphoheptulonate synthase [Saccharomonospora azurea]EHY91161.1 3-deoxy-D-arabino-heptulosonate 7-phosphate (DAHP) synthase [Saccharomonospora azurea NA-128]